MNNNNNKLPTGFLNELENSVRNKHQQQQQKMSSNFDTGQGNNSNKKNKRQDSTTTDIMTSNEVFFYSLKLKFILNILFGFFIEFQNDATIISIDTNER